MRKLFSMAMAFVAASILIPLCAEKPEWELV